MSVRKKSNRRLNNLRLLNYKLSITNKRMKKRLISYCIIASFIIIGTVVLNTQKSLAQNTIMNDTNGFTISDCNNGGCDSYGEYADECKQYCGDYGVNDFVLLGIKLTKIMLGFVGTLAFGAFVYGGVMFLASAGRKDWVDKGKSAMTNAIIGLVVVFSSYLIIQFTLQTLGYIKEGSTKPVDTTNFGDQNWNELPPAPKN